jgi:hypothetical protein
MADRPLGAYVYCVLAGDACPPLEDMRGVDPSHAVRAIRHAGLTALASDVSLTEFGAEPVKRNLNDRQWLERTARAHQGVLDRALAAGTIVPLRLCTICAGDDGVRALLERDHDVLTNTLERLAGREEWGLKLIVDPRPLRDASPSPAAEGPATAPGSGHAYVARLRRGRAAREEAQRVSRAAAQSIHRALAAEAVAAKVLRKPSRELFGDAGELVLNSTYLVEKARTAEFRALAAELGERHCPPAMRLELTGPWPPYSFLAERSDERRPSGAGLR